MKADGLGSALCGSLRSVLDVYCMQSLSSEMLCSMLE